MREQFDQQTMTIYPDVNAERIWRRLVVVVGHGPEAGGLCGRPKSCWRSAAALTPNSDEAPVAYPGEREGDGAFSARAAARKPASDGCAKGADSGAWQRRRT